jgi:hypothetical protein
MQMTGDKRVTRLAQCSENTNSLGLQWMNVCEIKDSKAILDLIRRILLAGS